MEVVKIHECIIQQSYPDDKMEEWQVSDAARNPRNDYPELIKPVNQLSR
jgi:putative SOS response-associated peptidase YedK